MARYGQAADYRALRTNQMEQLLAQYQQADATAQQAAEAAAVKALDETLPPPPPQEFTGSIEILED